MAALLRLLLTFAWRIVAFQRGPTFRSTKRMLIMGTGSTGISLARDVVLRPELKLKVVGFLDEHGQNIGKSLVNPCIIGATADVENVAIREKVDHVVLSLTERRGHTPVKQLLHLK